MEKNSIIKSISFSQDEILNWIIKLYCPKGFELDPTYSKGNFYKNIPQPKYCFDLKPQLDFVEQADCRNLPIADKSISTIIFDPPFLSSWGKNHNNISEKRFGFFKNRKELQEMYQQSLKEFYRILKKNGILVFKCQDFTCSGNEKATDMVHCFIYNWARELGFWAKDIFILLAKQRIFNPAVKQKTARKFHSYFWVFKKL